MCGDGPAISLARSMARSRVGYGSNRIFCAVACCLAPAIARAENRLNAGARLGDDGTGSDGGDGEYGAVADTVLPDLVLDVLRKGLDKFAL